ncbi:MAG: hypothetical protein NNA20_12410 [Nitrospira sp.]|nr:hypothetical protein [Nitrospira sp.]
MGDPQIIQDAVSRLEQRGIRHIVFVRMYALDHQMKPLTDYILGLSDRPPAGGHGGQHGSGGAPPQVRTAATFSTFGGYEQHPAISFRRRLPRRARGEKGGNESVNTCRVPKRMAGGVGPLLYHQTNAGFSLASAGEAVKAHQ